MRGRQQYTGSKFITGISGRTSNSATAKLLLPVILLIIALVAGACSSTSNSDGVSKGELPSDNPSVTITAEPAADTDDVSPAIPAKIAVSGATIQSVSLTNPAGKKVTGQLGTDNRSWATTEPLGYGKTYSWSGNAITAKGELVPISGSFDTVKPKKQIHGQLNVGDGQTYGIAMPVALTFDSKVTDKAAVEHALSVQTTPQVEGSWAWVENDTSVHWRPKEYFPPGTTVKVNANLYGVNFGDGSYGKENVSANFSIGRSQIVKGNTQSHRMQVIRDGQQVADYPVSYGLDSDPGRVTHSGTHVVMSKHATYSMSNPRYNYTDVDVPWAVRISNNGEFIHGLASSMWAQGKKNVSHGCLNLSPANAKEYFDGVLPGDPVEITGSTQQLGPEDGDYADWTYSWQQWTAKSALNA